MFDPARLIQFLSYALIPGIFAITVHEVAHGWAARRFGDRTAEMLGRLTLNPFKHVDPIGTVIVPLVTYIGFNFPFGWAKPVPVSTRNLRNPRRDMVLVAAAGPASNFLMATFWALVGALLIRGTNFGGPVARWVLDMSNFGIYFNVILAIVNLVPIPPLDGGRVLAGLLPRSSANFLERIEPFGFIIVLALMVLGVFSWLISPFVGFFYDFLSTSIAGLA